jgi:NTE family protein
MAGVTAFTENDIVRESVGRAKDCKAGGQQFSDIIDEQANQYVDLVMEGGGVLGIALTGYTYILEQAGIRFLGIGGTSAGCINALMIAALGPPTNAKSEELLRILAEIPMASFIDGDADARDFSHAALQKAGMMKLLWKAAQVVDNLKEDLGLNPGRAFIDWLTGALEQAGIHTNRDLQVRLETVPPGLRLREQRTDTVLDPATSAASSSWWRRISRPKRKSSFLGWRRYIGPNRTWSTLRCSPAPPCRSRCSSIRFE